MSKDRSNVVPVAITREAAREVMKRWLASGKAPMFVAQNVTKKGPRTWRIHAQAGRDFIKGTGIVYPQNPDHFKVYDLGTAQGIDPKTKRFCKPDPTINAWRTFDLSTATLLRRGNEAYTIIP